MHVTAAAKTTVKSLENVCLTNQQEAKLLIHGQPELSFTMANEQHFCTMAWPRRSLEFHVEKFPTKGPLIGNSTREIPMNSIY